MYKRLFVAARKHYFIFGPRSVGKSTWLKQEYVRRTLYINLLKTSEHLRYAQHPELIHEMVATGQYRHVIIDEIQRMPHLLNDVHDLIADQGDKIQFVLTGSSSRKLKKADTNLLAGRAVTRYFYPLVAPEYSYHPRDLDNILKFGTLPDVRKQAHEKDQGEILEAYTDTYLKEEIKEEALVRKLEPFVRFLTVAALMNGQKLNLSNIARDAAVKRTAVDGHFEILRDTLICHALPAWKMKARVKEVAGPKLYFFDTGVVRALAGRIYAPLDSAEKGFLFETMMINEIRAYLSYASRKGKLSYWGTPAGSEVDLIYSFNGKNIGMEFKSAPRWRAEFSAPLAELLQEKVLTRACAVYGGKEMLVSHGVTVYPPDRFLDALWSHQILDL